MRHESHVELLVGVFGPAPKAPAPKIGYFFSDMPCKLEPHLKKHDPRALLHARRCAWGRCAPLPTEVHSDTVAGMKIKMVVGAGNATNGEETGANRAAINGAATQLELRNTAATWYGRLSEI